MSKRKLPKRKLTKAEKRAKKERKAKYQFIFINGKQKRVRRPEMIEGLPIGEFIARNADPVWLVQNEMWEYLPEDPWPMETEPSEIGPNEIGPNEIEPSEIEPSEIEPSEIGNPQNLASDPDSLSYWEEEDEDYYEDDWRDMDKRELPSKADAKPRWKGKLPF